MTDNAKTGFSRYFQVDTIPPFYSVTHPMSKPADSPKHTPMMQQY